jgi:hypothetical protein
VAYDPPPGEVRRKGRLQDEPAPGIFPGRGKDAGGGGKGALLEYPLARLITTISALSPETRTLYVKVRSDILRARKDVVITGLSRNWARSSAPVTLDLQIDQGKNLEAIRENLPDRG